MSIKDYSTCEKCGHDFGGHYGYCPTAQQDAERAVASSALARVRADQQSEIDRLLAEVRRLGEENEQLRKRWPLSLRPSAEFMAVVEKVSKSPAWNARDIRTLIGFAVLHCAAETVMQPGLDTALSREPKE